MLGPASVEAQRRALPSPGTMIGVAHAIIQQGMLKRGPANTFTVMMLDSAALVWPGMPVVTSKDRIGAALGLVERPGGVNLQLQPLRMLLATDSTVMLVYGVAHWSLPDGSPGEFGRYLMAWRRRDNGWKLGAFGLMDVGAAAPAVWPDSLQAQGGEAVLISSGDPAPFVGEDLAFAAGPPDSAPEAYRRWATEDAVTFSPIGFLWRGPEQIAAAIAQYGTSHWQWRPVAAGAADDGSLGWTVGEGEAVIEATAERPGRVLPLTYLTLWQRQADGTLRYIARGMNGWP